MNGGMSIQALFDEKEVKNIAVILGSTQRAKSASPSRAVLFISFLFLRSIELILVSLNLRYYISSGQFVH